MSTPSKVEQDLRAWLRDHYGVISWLEARRLGASADLIRAKIARGEWKRMYRGVYRDTATPITYHQELRAAFVAARGCGVVSHRSAGWLWELLPQPPHPPELTVGLEPTLSRRPAGVVIHRYADLDRSHAVTRQGMLVTNPMRTIVDLAGAMTSDELTDVVDVALGRRLVNLAALIGELDRLSCHGRPGVGRLRAHLVERGFTGAPEPSVLEAKTRRLVITPSLPLPTVELRVGEDGEYRLDIAWGDVKLAVEVDGYVWHFSPAHLQRDTARRNRLQADGWTVLVYTWRDINNEPRRVLNEIVRMHGKLSHAAQQ